MLLGLMVYWPMTRSVEENEIQPGVTIAAYVGRYIALCANLVFAIAYEDETGFAGGVIDSSDRVIGTLIIGGQS